MTGDEAAARAARLFLDERHPYGCAETTLLVLKEALGPPEPGDSSAAMALNGGVACTGQICGALSGAGIALGLLAGRRIRDHAVAKRVAREITGGLTDRFRDRFGSTDCRSLLGRDIRTPEQHQAFLDSGIWRDVCLAQIDFAVRDLAGVEGSPRWVRHRPRPAGRLVCLRCGEVAPVTAGEGGRRSATAAPIAVTAAVRASSVSRRTRSGTMSTTPSRSFRRAACTSAREMSSAISESLTVSTVRASTSRRGPPRDRHRARSGGAACSAAAHALWRGRPHPPAIP